MGAGFSFQEKKNSEIPQKKVWKAEKSLLLPRHPLSSPCDLGLLSYMAGCDMIKRGISRGGTYAKLSGLHSLRRGPQKSHTQGDGIDTHREEGQVKAEAGTGEMWLQSGTARGHQRLEEERQAADVPKSL